MNDHETTKATTAATATNKKKKLRVMIISMGGSRQEQIQAMFAVPPFCDEFEPPVFSAGVPSRWNRHKLLHTCYEVGLIPEAEWHTVDQNQDHPLYLQHPERFFECLKHVPVVAGRKGSAQDVQLHYSVEFWRKAKGINRGRSVLACFLAHLRALKTFTAPGADFDVLLEDNVRAPLNQETARRIRETVQASLERESATGEPCHLRYYGWLGSTLNLEWMYQSHIPKRKWNRKEAPSQGETAVSVVSFPIPEDLEHDLNPPENSSNQAPYLSKLATQTVFDADAPTDRPQHDQPGGTPVWGAYAYWMSRPGYDAILEILRQDIGALMFKGKRARCYKVKPVDKVFPRKLMERFGPSAVQLTTHPTFFRAPMLTSKIHTQFDPEFCKSTEYQLAQINQSWNVLWLTPEEKKVVDHRKQTGKWLTPAQLLQREQEEPIV